MLRLVEVQKREGVPKALERRWHDETRCYFDQQVLSGGFYAPDRPIEINRRSKHDVRAKLEESISEESISEESSMKTSYN